MSTGSCLCPVPFLPADHTKWPKHTMSCLRNCQTVFQSGFCFMLPAKRVGSLRLHWDSYVRSLTCCTPIPSNSILSGRGSRATRHQLSLPFPSSDLPVQTWQKHLGKSAPLLAGEVLISHVTGWTMISPFQVKGSSWSRASPDLLGYLISFL